MTVKICCWTEVRHQISESPIVLYGFLFLYFSSGFSFILLCIFFNPPEWLQLVNKTYINDKRYKWISTGNNSLLRRFPSSPGHVWLPKQLVVHKAFCNSIYTCSPKAWEPKLAATFYGQPKNRPQLKVVITRTIKNQSTKRVLII